MSYCWVWASLIVFFLHSLKQWKRQRIHTWAWLQTLKSSLMVIHILENYRVPQWIKHNICPTSPTYITWPDKEENTMLLEDECLPDWKCLLFQKWWRRLAKWWVPESKTGTAPPKLLGTVQDTFLLPFWLQFFWETASMTSPSQVAHAVYRSGPSANEGMSHPSLTTVNFPALGSHFTWFITCCSTMMPLNFHLQLCGMSERTEIFLMLWNPTGSHSTFSLHHGNGQIS